MLSTENVKSHGPHVLRNPIEVIPWPAVIGAEVKCGDLRHLDDETSKAVYQAWLDNLVVVFRGQDLSDDDLLAFARHFGENHEAAPPHMMPVGMKARHNPLIGIISNVIENGVPIGSLGFGKPVSPPLSGISRACRMLAFSGASL